ncbi:hypothetical protein WDZ92_38170, partial [Nostoc sp. NIES-2111]
MCFEQLTEVRPEKRLKASIVGRQPHAPGQVISQGGLIRADEEICGSGVPQHQVWNYLQLRVAILSQLSVHL